MTTKYHRTIHGVTLDVYDILHAYGVTNPAVQHAVKKLLMPGRRGAKSVLEDLEEARASVERAVELQKQQCPECGVHVGLMTPGCGACEDRITNGGWVVASTFQSPADEGCGPLQSGSKNRFLNTQEIRELDEFFSNAVNAALQSVNDSPTPKPQWCECGAVMSPAVRFCEGCGKDMEETP